MDLSLFTHTALIGLYRSSTLLAHIEDLVQNTDGEWKQVYPMREDINMYKLPVMSEAHSAITFDKEIQLDGMEEVTPCYRIMTTDNFVLFRSYFLLPIL